MKQGTLYSSRLKKGYARFRQSVPKPEIPGSDDPLHRLGIAIFAVECDEEQATRAIDNALDAMVDWNEIRVSSPSEVNRATGGTITNGLRHCRRLIAALDAVYERENRLSLNRLRSMGRREARQYLETLSAVDDYAVASVLLWSLGGHGVPVSDRLLTSLREANLVHPSANRGEVQAFLERHISAADAKEFSIVMQSFTPNHPALKKHATAKGKTPSSKTKAK